MQIEMKNKAILTSDKMCLKTTIIVRDKERHYIIIKGTINQEDITPVNIYGPNIVVPKYLKQILMDIKGEINSNTVIVIDFNTSLMSMTINKKTLVVNGTFNRMDLIGIFRAFHPKAAEYAFFSTTHGTFSRIDHMLGHKTSLYKYKKIEITSLICGI